MLIGYLILPRLEHTVNTSDSVQPNKRITRVIIPQRPLHILFAIADIQLIV
jgi:hypothetical protein